jgi:hypothetical protein
MQLIREKNLGFKKDNVVYFEVEPDLRMKLKPFLSELRSIPGVVNASGMDGNFVGEHSGGGGIEWDGKAPGDAVEFAGFYANHEWVETMGVDLSAGRSFSERFAGDSAGVLFNEAAIRAMRLQNPVGKKVKMWGKEAVITGVMKDFHYESLYNRPGPMFVRYAPSNTNVIAKIESGSEKLALSRIRDLYKAYNNGLEFDYKFVDEDFARLYEAENRTAELSTWFTGLAILISCLGLFGLTAFMAQRRQKEIGIRKVVGAAVHQVVILLSAEFLKLVSVALIVAFPVAWWVMNRWLDNFAYRVAFTADIFIIATIAIFLITIVTVSIQSVKAAVVNPAKSLRTL